MIGYPRFPISELHLGKFLDSTEFQSWKVNIKTEFRSKTAYLHLTLQWIKEVDDARSIDELDASRSVTGQTTFLDFDMFDGEIASALKKRINTQSNFRKRVSVDEQRAQTFDRFLRGRQIVYMIYVRAFPCNRTYEAVQGLSNLLTKRSQNDDVQDFDVRWDQALLSASGTHSDVILEGLYKSKLQDSVRLQTVLALYDQELVRNNGHTSYLRLKTSGKLHVAQMMRTRNFRVLNEVLERGAVTKSQKGKKAYVERKVGNCFQLKAHGQCSKGDSCSFSHDKIASGNSGSGQRRKKDDRLLPHQFEGND